MEKKTGICALAALLTLVLAAACYDPDPWPIVTGIRLSVGEIVLTEADADGAELVLTVVPNSLAQELVSEWRIADAGVAVFDSPDPSRLSVPIVDGKARATVFFASPPAPGTGNVLDDPGTSVTVTVTYADEEGAGIAVDNVLGRPLQATATVIVRQLPPEDD